MKRFLLTISSLIIFYSAITAQIINGQDTLYGNEWIKFDQTYFKIMVAEDGIYRLGKQDLLNAGMPIDQMTGDQLQVFHNGEEISLYTSTNAIFTDTDYLEFYGEKNRSQLDRHLFVNPDEEMINPYYSLFTDTSAYYLTWTTFGIPKRYEEIENDLTNLPAKQEYYMAELVQEYHNAWAKEQNSQGVSLSNFTRSEGFSSSFVNAQNFNLTPVAPYLAGSSAKLNIRYSGNLKNHQTLISLNGQALTTDEFYGYEVRNLEFDLDNNVLNSTMNLSFQGLTDGTDRQRIGYIKLTYPRQFNFENKTSYSFNLTASNSKQYFEIDNFNEGNYVILYDLTNGERVETLIENNLIKFSLPASSLDRELFLINNESGIKSPASIQQIDFINYSAIDVNFIFLSNPRLFDDGNGNNYVQEYADYRESTDGGSYQTLIVDIQQVYDQFGWGLNRHSLSIRNFAHFIQKNWTDPQYFFIVGKGREYQSQRTAISPNLFVPTFGVPGSDNQLLAGGDGFTPVIPIGRIAAQSTEDIKIYFDKIKEFEANKNLPQTIEDRAWMKRVLHMGGGLTNAEQSTIKGNLADMESLIENNSFGGEVQSFFKTSSDPIQVSQTEQIFRVINDGVSLISFFGHSSVNGFDFSIDNPDNYQNQNKYPMIVSLGCYSGNLHTGSAGVGERFVFFENKGAIAFGATSGQGYISSLSVFAREFYNQIGGDFYGAGIGDALKKAVSSFSAGDFGLSLIRQQFNLQGDPSLRLNTTPGPDYTVDATSVAFSPSQLTSQLKEFELFFDVVNLGKNVVDSIKLSITQELPDGTKVKAFEILVPAPSFRSNFTIKIPSLGATAVGFNRFYIEVDAGNRVEELPSPEAENNNQLMTNGALGISKYISDNSVVCVYPTEFGIVNSPDITLKATTTNLLLSERMYVIQMDTTETFDSPVFISTKISQPGGVLRWQPMINWKDNTVYYWRVSSDSISQAEPFNWSNSSFNYLPGSSNGWNQSHFYQLKKDEFVDMELLSPGNLKFLDNFKDVFIRNSVNSLTNMELQINNAFRGRMYGTPPGMYVVVFDSTTTKEWINFQPSAYGIINPNNHNVPMYLFSTQDLTSRTQLIEFLEDVVPPKNFVLVFTNQFTLTSDYKPQEWESDMNTLGTDLFEVLESQGANLIRNTITNGSLPYVFAYQKNVGPITEALADSLTQVLRVNFGIPGYWDRGSVKSTPIGPAKNWTKLIFDIDPTTLTQTDTFSIDLLAFDPLTLSDTVLMVDLSPGEYDISHIAALTHPLLKLRFNSEDSLLRSSPQVSYWRVLYQGVPDFSINPAGYFSFESDTLPQGKALELDYLIENLSEASDDSLSIRYAIKNAFNEEIEIFQTIRPLIENDTFVAHVSFDTRLLNGFNSLQVELNPGDLQPELTRVNNVLSNSFQVEKDLRNPLLDVTFDGVSIFDGDLVSARPVIRISLKDENPFLALEDTAIFRLFLVYPDSSETLRRIYFNDPQLQFFPASANNLDQLNKAAVELRPILLKDGEYQLLVQAQDVSGNASGSFDYKIRFKVITKSMISNVLNYPNPFTTSTNFVYTLTGIEPPERFKIQIMTVSGRIVRELTQNELGTLKVGTHQTDYAWDGTDEFGDQLAKGVYLYRVLVQDANGKEWEMYETGADAYVKNGYGKMVLLR